MKKFGLILIVLIVVGCGGGVEHYEKEEIDIIGDILKVWETDSLEFKTTYYLVMMDGDLRIKKKTPVFFDKFNPGVRVVGKRTEQGVEYTSGENNISYIINKKGDLLVSDGVNIIETAKEIDSENGYQMFPEINLALKCPCLLEIDSVPINYWYQMDSLPVVTFNCKEDGSGDLYNINALLTKDSIYSEEEFIYKFTQALDSNKNVSYEYKYIDFKNAIEIKYKEDNKKQLLLFLDKSTTYFIVNASDSLDLKFEWFTNSLIKYY